jgi:hypothetical protein
VKCWKKKECQKKEEIVVLRIMCRIEDDEIESGPEGEDEVVSTQSTRNKKNTANNTYSCIHSIYP